MRVTVIDYKAGNLTSVLKTLRHLGAEPVVTDGDLSLVETAERIVLPGVGHFAATERLDATGLTGAIRAAIARGVPFLGICVGMQWLYAGSTEAPQQPGQRGSATRPHQTHTAKPRLQRSILPQYASSSSLTLIPCPAPAFCRRPGDFLPLTMLA